MSRNKQQRGHRPPPQSRVQPGGIPLIDADRQKVAQEQHEAQMRQRVESVAATIFTENIKINGADDESDTEWENYCERIADRSIDAALILGREIWGVQGQRQKAPHKPKRSPNVITEDDDNEES